MVYRENIISQFRALENYARTIFVIQLGLPNGQGVYTNKIIDKFMADLTGGELCFTEKPRQGEQILLDACIYELLPQCQKAAQPRDTFLWFLIGNWIHDNIFQCQECGDYRLSEDCDEGLCEDCAAERNANDPDTIADFMYDLSKEDR